jgi:chromosome segregation ATPase
MKKFINNNATETLREDNQKLINKINKQLEEKRQVITNQSKTIENLNTEIEVLKRKYETEKSLREELQENIKVLDEDNKSFRKKFEESEKKICEHNKDLENYSLKADEFVGYYKNECLKYKNELKEVKEKYKNFETQTNFSRDYRIGICEEYERKNSELRKELEKLKQEKSKITQDFIKEKMKLKTSDSQKEVLKKEIMNLKEIVEKQNRDNYSEENKNLKQKCEELETKIAEKNKKLQEFEEKIVDQNKSFKNYISNNEQYVSGWKNYSIKLKNELRDLDTKWKEEISKGKCLELQRDSFKQENKKLSEELKEEKLKNSGNLNQEIINIKEDLKREKLKSRTFEIQNEVLIQEKKTLSFVVEQEREFLNIMENRFRKQTKLSENYKNLNENNVRIVIFIANYFKKNIIAFKICFNRNVNYWQQKSRVKNLRNFTK